jgi:integrase/recombinase XerD
VAEGGGLLNRYRTKSSIGGSNPPLSAIAFHETRANQWNRAIPASLAGIGVFSVCSLCTLLLLPYPLVTLKRDTMEASGTPQRSTEGHYVSTIRVLRQVHVDGKWQRLPVAKVGDRLDWGRLKYKGKFIPSTAGTFFLEYRDPGKKRRAVGNTVRDAKAAMLTQASVIELRAKGIETEDAPEIVVRRAKEGKTIAEVERAIVKRPPLGLRPTSVTKYQFEMGAFAAWARRHRLTHLAQLGREEIKAYMTDLVRVDQYAMKTAVNKAVIVTKVLRDAGCAIAMKKGDWPRITETQPDIYTPEMLKPLFAAMRANEFALYQTFLLSGFRDQEIGFLAWEDVHVREGSLRVSKKLAHGFDPKNYMERTVPVPPQLMETLAQHKLRQEKGEYFVFPTSRQLTLTGKKGGQRDKHMLHKLKQIALRAGLNCGRCETTYQKKPASCADKPVCALWTLHKFRHTYATTQIQDGFDIVTVQHLLGHKDIETTMRYLRMVQGVNLRKKMDNAAIATMFI